MGENDDVAVVLERMRQLAVVGAQDTAAQHRLDVTVRVVVARAERNLHRGVVFLACRRDAHGDVAEALAHDNLEGLVAPLVDVLDQ